MGSMFPCPEHVTMKLFMHQKGKNNPSNAPVEGKEEEGVLLEKEARRETRKVEGKGKDEEQEEKKSIVGGILRNEMNIYFIQALKSCYFFLPQSHLLFLAPAPGGPPR